MKAQLRPGGVERLSVGRLAVAMQGPVAPACPASLLRAHPAAALFLDRDSTSLLQS